MANLDLHSAHVTYTSLGPMVISPADEIIEMIWDEENIERRVMLAASALTLDPQCIEAYLIMADHCEDKLAAANMIGKAINAGADLWSPISANNDIIEWWDCIGTRPYMRAIFALGELAAEVGDHQMARECFEKLVKMHPNDALNAHGELAKLDRDKAFDESEGDVKNAP